MILGTNLNLRLNDEQPEENNTIYQSLPPAATSYIQIAHHENQSNEI